MVYHILSIYFQSIVKSVFSSITKYLHWVVIHKKNVLFTVLNVAVSEIKASAELV